MRIAYSVLYVADLAAMTRFYHDLLGLPVAEQNDRFRRLRRPRRTSGPRNRRPHPRRPPRQRPQPHPRPVRRRRHRSQRRRSRQQNIPIEGDIRRGPFGALAFFRDPEGNRLALLQSP
ncbi:MAG: VOC family protein [Chloroflexia bacterium]